MKRRFKTKSNVNKYKKIIWIIFLIIGFFLSYMFIYYKFSNSLSLEDYLNILIKTSFNYQIDSSYFNKSSDILNINKIDTIAKEKTSNTNSPIVYIYNTHDEEWYQKENNNEYNITPTVKMATYYLQEKLNNLGISTIIEKRNIKSILNEKNWLYKYSYQASRIYLEDTYNNNPSLKYFIDLHRDSSVREKTIVDINGKTYAKIMFIVGLEHSNYKENLQVTEKLNNLIKKYYPTLSRGIYKKSGVGVNGIYNQDFNKNCILIELGGQYNTIEEISNTLDILAPILKEFINEEN